jgi:8-oxo-dGTP diphosphatase
MRTCVPSVDRSLPQRTLALVLREGRLLLGEKVVPNSATTVGSGMLNGPGGKLIEAYGGIAAVWHDKYAETPEQCVCRETHDECGIVVEPSALRPHGTLSFYWPEHKMSWNQLVHVYVCGTFSGEPQGTDEMAGWDWFAIDDLPWQRMFQADQYWLPHVLVNHKTIQAVFEYDHDLRQVRRFDIWDAMTGKRLEEYVRL